MSDTTQERSEPDWRPLPTTSRPEIVVATPHQGLVTDRLFREFGIRAEERDSSPGLGLTLLKLPGVDEDGGPRLDDVFDRLYRSFHDDLHWVPTFGKNREVASVVPQNKTDPGVAPLNKTDPGDDGAPKAVDAATAAWPARATSPGKGVRVGVGDTAVVERPELWGSVVADTKSLLPRYAEEQPAQLGHGTFVTGLIVREAPGAAMHVRRLLDEAPLLTDSWEVAKRLVHFAEDGVHVLNLSLGCHTDDDEPPLVFARALERIGPDVVVVAAAGNFAPGQPRKAVWPAAFQSVVAVGATGADGEEVPWSPDPAKSPWVDVLAVGDQVTSLYLDGQVLTGRVDADGKPLPRPFTGFGAWSGTSFAAARVTGMIAAGTVPGQRGAREALDVLIAAAKDRGDVRGGRPWLR